MRLVITLGMHNTVVSNTMKTLVYVCVDFRSRVETQNNLALI